MKNKILLLNKYTCDYKIGDLFIIDGTEHVLEVTSEGGFVDCHFGPMLERGMIAMILDICNDEEIGFDILLYVNSKFLIMPFRSGNKPPLALLDLNN